MREAKARSEIDRIPGGRRKRGLPPRSKDRIIARGQRLIEQAIAEMAKAKKNLPAVPERPWEEKTVGEKFSANFVPILGATAGQRHTQGEVSPLNTGFALLRFMRPLPPRADPRGRY
jgi:hypothetical protein